MGHLPSTRTARHRSGAALVAMVAVVAPIAAAGCADDADGRTVIVAHPATPAPTYLDLGAAGESAGDVRIFNFPGTTDDGAPVRTDWIMTTTAIDMPEAGVETRIAKGVFTFGDEGDQLILEGAALYPGEGATLAPATRVVRSIIGGSGAYAGASGSVESVRADDGSWTHTFTIDD